MYRQAKIRMMAAHRERRKVTSGWWICVCVCRVVQAVDESHFTAPITGLCSANAVWLVLLLSPFYSLPTFVPFFLWLFYAMKVQLETHFWKAGGVTHIPLLMQLQECEYLIFSFFFFGMYFFLSPRPLLFITDLRRSFLKLIVYYFSNGIICILWLCRLSGVLALFRLIYWQKKWKI